MSKSTTEGGQRRLVRNFDMQKAVPYITLLVLVVILSLYNEHFLQLSTFQNLLQSQAATGIVAIGAMCVIITGGIDFTTGYGLATASVTAGVLYVRSGNNAAVLLLAGVAVGLVFGLCNGLLITKWKLPPFIATFAMMSVLQGMALLISEGRQYLITDKAALWVGQGYIFGVIPVPFVIFLAMCAAGYLLLNRTKMGVYIYAMGGNEEAAVYAGVKVNRYKLLVYVFAGFCTGVASVITTTRIALISASVSGDILMDAISAVVIGGTSVSGGKGAISGTIAGVLIMGLISAALTYLNVDTLLRNVVKGVVIILALLLDFAMNKNRSAA